MSASVRALKLMSVDDWSSRDLRVLRLGILGVRVRLFKDIGGDRDT